jgi:hypothetical protein
MTSWLKHGPIELAEPKPFPVFDDPPVEVPPEVNQWMAEAVTEMVKGLSAISEPQFLEAGFLIDLSQPPYTVPCPTCLAFALEPCRHERREGARETPFGPVPGGWPATARIVREAHPARQRHWETRPEYRVTPLLSR